MGVVKKSGLALFLALTGSVAMGGQAALADGSATMSLPAAPAPDALLTHGVGTAAQSIALPVPDQGHDGLLDADGNLVDRLTVDGVGTYQIDVNGILTFRPAVGYVGTHSVVYRAIDAFEQTGDGTYTPEVDQPAAPAAPTVSSSGIGTALQSATVDVPTQGTAVLLDSTGAETTSTSLPGVGAFRIESTTGNLTFAPAFGYRGTASISYRVTDAYGQTTTGAYTASVAAPQAPVAVPASTRGAANVQQVVRIQVPSGATLALVDQAGSVSTHVFLPGQGNYAVDPASATITFTPGQGFVGTGSLTYQLTDAYGQVSQSAYTPMVLRARERTVEVQHTVGSHHSTTSEPHRQPPLTSAVLMPPLVLTAPGLPQRSLVHALPAAHVKATAVPVRAKVRVVHAKAPAPAKRVVPAATEAPVPAAASGIPTASVVVQQLTAASTDNDILHNRGKLAGLALIIVNSFVMVAALLLNRRRRNT